LRFRISCFGATSAWVNCKLRWQRAKLDEIDGVGNDDEDAGHLARRLWVTVVALFLGMFSMYVMRSRRLRRLSTNFLSESLYAS